MDRLWTAAIFTTVVQRCFRLLQVIARARHSFYMCRRWAEYYLKQVLLNLARASVVSCSTSVWSTQEEVVHRAKA